MKFLARLRYLLLGHDLQVWQHFGKGSRRVICEECGGDWGMHDETRAFVPWDHRFREMYEAFGHRVRPTPMERGSDMKSVRQER